MASRAGLLRYSNDLVRVLESRNRWLPSRILNEKFYNRESITAASPFELVEGGDDQVDPTPLSHFMYQTMFADHSQGERIVISPRSILRTRI